LKNVKRRRRKSKKIERAIQIEKGIRTKKKKKKKVELRVCSVLVCCSARCASAHNVHTG